MIKELKDYEVHYKRLEDWNKDYYGATYPMIGIKKDDMLRYGRCILHIVPLHDLIALVREAQAKLAVLLSVKQLQRKFDSEDVPITVMAVDPGYVFTEGFTKDPLHKIPILGPVFTFVFKRIFSTPVQGAQGSVFAATSPEVAENRESFKGAYLVPPGRIGTPPHPQAGSRALAEELLEATESISKQWVS